jgi:GNAT superfamily N-acetyltransferase
MPFDITIAETDAEILATYDVMSQLRPHVGQSDYLALVRLQQSEVGFQLAFLRKDDRVACVAGFRFCRSLGWGKYLYVDDLVTDEIWRSHGFGKAMFDWLVNLARKTQCDELRLDSAVSRHDAHRFYLRERMDIVCIHFRLALEKQASSEALRASD